MVERLGNPIIVEPFNPFERFKTTYDGYIMGSRISLPDSTAINFYLDNQIFPTITPIRAGLRPNLREVLYEDGDLFLLRVGIRQEGTRYTQSLDRVLLNFRNEYGLILTYDNHTYMGISEVIEQRIEVISWTKWASDEEGGLQQGNPFLLALATASRLAFAIGRNHLGENGKIS